MSTPEITVADIETTVRVLRALANRCPNSGRFLNPLADELELDKEEAAESLNRPTE